MKVEGKTALITGGGSGIGLSIAKKLIDNGAKVIICGRNMEKLEKVKANNSLISILQCDVSNDAQIKEVVTEVNKKYGGIDILINNAGVIEMIDYKNEGVAMDIIEREVNIDLLGPIRMVQHFLPSLKRRKEAAIVNVSSGLAFVPLTLAPVYSATKAGIHAWTRSLRYQIGAGSVKVFELMPPLVKTEMTVDFEGQKMMDSEVLAANFLKGFLADKYEITPGQSSQLRMMSRMAPNFIFKAVNKQFS